jgi:hypothetical protein
MTTVMSSLVVDRGPVRDAALLLINRSTLADHVVTSDDGAYGTRIEMDQAGVPFELWGSGTQALWRLLSAIAYTRHEISLYEVVSRLDQPNRAAVSDAISVLCRAA